jgi:outer membrane protein OmpA-like peptidoglycan-associated protein
MIKPLILSLVMLALLAACSDEVVLDESKQPKPVTITSQKIIKKPLGKPVVKKHRKVVIDSCKKIDRNIHKKSISKKPVKFPATTTTSFVVFFEPGTLKITPASNSVLKGMLEKLSGQKEYEVAIIDKSSSKEIDTGLSQKRVSLVKDQLTKIGIREAAIKTGDEKVINNKIKHKVEVFLND